MKKTALILGILFVFAASGLARPNSATAAQGAAVKIQKAEPFSYFCLKHKGPYSAIQEVISRLLLESHSQNVFPTGPLMGIYYNSPEQVGAEQLEWEMGFPMTPQSLVQPPLEKKEWNFTEVAVALHKGPYEKAGETISKIMQWMEANGYAPAGPVMERYLDMNPREIKPADLKTEIWIPIKSSQDR